MSDLYAILDEPMDTPPDDVARDLYTVGYAHLMAGRNLSEADAHADWAAWLAAHDREVRADEREKIAQECEAHASARGEVTFERMRDPLPGDYVAKGNTGGLRIAARLIRAGRRAREKPVPKGRVRVAIDVRLHATVPAGEASLPVADKLIESVLAPGWVEALRPEVRGVQRDE